MTVLLTSRSAWWPVAALVAFLVQSFAALVVAAVPARVLQLPRKPDGG